VANDERQKAFASGCADYISKPTKQELLLALLRNYIWKKMHEPNSYNQTGSLQKTFRADSINY
jgi:CheY-like chemotaxis protein